MKDSHFYEKYKFKILHPMIMNGQADKMGYGYVILSQESSILS